MLPFLAKKKDSQPGLIVQTRTPDEIPGEEESEDPAAAIKACSQALISAVHAKDVTGVSEALKDAFDILESMPHEENESAEPHSYDAQNIKAGQE